MKSKIILILTHAQDDCANLVINQLQKKKHAYIRFNTEEFHSKIKLSIKNDEFGNFECYYQFPETTISFDDIGAVWNRRVHDPEPSTDLNHSPELKAWMKEEISEALKISFTLLKCPVVNPWEINERLKFNKIIQMQRAASLGLKTPFTLLTNIDSEIENFWKKTDYDVIFKKIRKGLFCFSNNETFIVHTTRIPKELFTNESIKRMRFCPMLFQKHIQKKVDVRSIIINDEVFSVAIYSQEFSEYKTDYRKANIHGMIDKIKHEIIDLGPIINKKLTAFTKSFGLTFSAIDLIITPDDDIIFLEDNPNGQWGWLEYLTNIPISEAVARTLINLCS